MSVVLSFKNGSKARKQHRCALCFERINVGDTQDTRTGACSDGMWSMHMHPECHAYERKPGVVDADWYEDAYDPAFERKDAIAYWKLSNQPNAEGREKKR